MPRIFIIGATGGVGHRLYPLLTAAGHDVSGLHRSEKQAKDLRAAGVTPVQGDIIEMSQEDFAAAMAGADAVVFSAGAGGGDWDKTEAIDGKGAEKAIAAAQAQGIERFYLVSVIPDAGRDRDLDDGFEQYMSIKKRVDTALAASDLKWIILRPGTLTDDDGDGRVNVGPVIPYGDVARGNVAATLAALIDTPDLMREIVEVTDGDTPVRDAVAALTRDR
ncbi:NAD(P)H-binding protein [Sulfitobacter sabulilitoris]|uniref:NAD-dependent epimerase/dehydratase family protein n=1 Tax=Sulfitobacter sabulilitoris TaxID=2562655 RepID=A0A5S3PE81_9RHOB|nr:NAD(P)H-binding protein [Sulfitobacter sabulilitoris]TMM52345.1 NAD-dependent epimerase/dehydratase family protein [Sulfitobacter sabulilitoris]